ncbi:hypothetical protein LIER_11831 [Lithospermum erythrorhizon]|uniref:Rubber elongation factor n=1 Tax=Lithospermum erythrorhizon TaxID=34254 RepID=A0AAV3PPZ8_LITER
MAATDITIPQQPPMDVKDENELKYLEFVQVSTLQAVLCAAKLYDYAKDNSGPLKPGVQSVEGTVKTVVGPVYDKFHGVPFELLKFVDRKVDKSATKIDSYVPPVVKQVSTNAISAAQKAPAAARTVASEVKTAGVIGTASGLAKTVYTKYEPAAKDLYSKYEPVAEQYATSAWRRVNRLPLVPRMAEAVAPTASFCTEKYNQTVLLTADKGYKVASFLPLVPTDKIAKVLSDGKNGPVVSN